MAVVPHLGGAADELVAARAFHPVDAQVRAADADGIFRGPGPGRVVLRGDEPVPRIQRGRHRRTQVHITEPEHQIRRVEHDVVDGAGVRSCYESADAITKKGLGFVTGTIYRHHTGYLESIARVHGGDIGEITGAIGWYNTSGLWRKDRQPEWSELEYQMRNWIYYTWLAGDHIVEQAVHNVDALQWIMGANPVRAVASIRGRDARPALSTANASRCGEGSAWSHFTSGLVARPTCVMLSRPSRSSTSITFWY